MDLIKVNATFPEVISITSNFWERLGSDNSRRGRRHRHCCCSSSSRWSHRHSEGSSGSIFVVAAAVTASLEIAEVLTLLQTALWINVHRLRRVSAASKLSVRDTISWKLLNSPCLRQHRAAVLHDHVEGIERGQIQ